MFPIIAAVVGVVAVGAYLLNEEESKNTSAKNNYKKAVSDAEEKVTSHYAEAQSKERLDQLVKVREAKVKIADEISVNLKEVEQNFEQINAKLKETQKRLKRLEEENQVSHSAQAKRDIQKRINLVRSTSKELLSIKETLDTRMEVLREELVEVKAEVTQIQNEIDRV